MGIFKYRRRQRMGREHRERFIEKDDGFLPGYDPMGI
jgi:hypothetical protein